MTDKPPPPKIYEPSDHDALRDGLFKGFWAHLKPLQNPPGHKQ